MSEAQTQYLDVPLPLGVDTATQAELVQPGKALAVRNCHVGNGALIERRPFTREARGFVVDNGTDYQYGEVKQVLPLADSYAIATEDGRVAAVGVGGVRLRQVDRTEAPVSYRKTIHQGPLLDTHIFDRQSYHYPSIAVGGLDYACITWWRRQPAVGAYPAVNTAYATIYNLTTGVTMRTDPIGASVGVGSSADGSNPSLVPVYLGSHFRVLYINTSTNNLEYVSFSTSDFQAGWTAPATLTGVAVLGDSGSFDACVFGSAGYVVFNGLAGNLTAIRITSSGTSLNTTHTVSYAGSGVGTAIAVSADATRLLIAHSSTAGAVYAIVAFTSNLAIDGARTQLSSAATSSNFKQIACCVYTAYSTTGVSRTKATVVWTDEDAVITRHGYKSWIANLSIEGLAAYTPELVEVAGTNLCHRPFRRSGQLAIPMGYPSFVGLRRNQTLEDTYYTYVVAVDRADPTLNTVPTDYNVTPVARYGALVAGYFRDTVGTQDICAQGVSAVIEHGGRYHWVGAEQSPTYDGSTRDSLQIYSLDFSRDACWSSIVVNGITMIAGSIPRMISPEVATISTTSVPARGVEGIVPMHSPPPLTLTGVTGTGALTATAKYYYRQTYEHVDVRGHLQRGAPSPAQEITLAAGNNEVTLGYSAYQSPQPGYNLVRIVVWRSIGNPPDANAITYYRLTEQTISAIALNPTHSDRLADSSLDNNEILYTVSGELDNFPPPPSCALALWKNRIVALDSETGRIWPSKAILPGEWPGFHEGLAVSTDVHTSLPIYLSEDTDNLIVWWRDAIGVAYGEPGGDTGAIGSLTQPRLLGQRGIGLKYVRSLVRTSIGHMFMSTRGIYLLSPDMQLVYIGHDVQAYNSAVIVGAYVAENPNGSQEVRFETQTLESGNYVALVYDLAKQAWHIHTRGRKPLAAANVAGRVYVSTESLAGTDDPWTGDFLPDASGLWRESTSTTLPTADAADPSGTYQASVDTAWLAFAGKMGSARVRRLWLLGDFHTSGTLERLTQALAYRDYASAVAQTLSFQTTDATRRLVEASFNQQEVSALRLSISGFQRLMGMRIEVETEKGATRRNNLLATG